MSVERDLREARANARRWRELQEAHVWRTDAAHRLISWQGPGLPEQAHCALFEPMKAGTGPGALPGLGERLRSQVAFAGLRLQRSQPQHGARHWELSGWPQVDDLGVFSGYLGTARPMDEIDALQGAAAALPALVACTDAASLVALPGPGGWHTLHASEAARKQWPGLADGADFNALLAALPEPVRRAAQVQLQAATEAQAGPRPVSDSGEAVAGWRMQVFGPLPDGRCGVVLSQHKPATAIDAEQAAANAESEQFSFTVSHDLRAPIRVVEGFTRIVKEDYGRLLDRVGNDHLDRVLGAAARMNLMIDALLTLARLSTQPLAHQAVNLSQLAGWVADELVRSAPDRLVEIEIEPGLTARGDPTLLRLVLENLLGNAWKYSARTVKAQISLRRVPHGSGGAYVVRDNGAGFDMRSAERLFGLFQRLHSASEFSGHGVGLASVRRIVRRHGGEIWAEAEIGRGAAFYFTLAS
jgi:signal transduction histidine kinase